MFTTAKARAKMGRAYPEPAALRKPQIKESLSLCSDTSAVSATSRQALSRVCRRRRRALSSSRGSITWRLS